MVSAKKVSKILADPKVEVRELENGEYVVRGVSRKNCIKLCLGGNVDMELRFRGVHIGDGPTVIRLEVPGDLIAA